MKIAILGIVGVLLAIPLKVHKAEYAMFLSMAVCICIFVYIISKIQIIYNYVNSLKNLLPIDGKYIAVILKMIGIKRGYQWEEVYDKNGKLLTRFFTTNNN